MRTKTKNQIEADSHRKIYEYIKLMSRREFCLNSRIVKASNEKGKTKNAYIVEAIEQALERDGLPRPTTDK